MNHSRSRSALRRPLQRPRAVAMAACVLFAAVIVPFLVLQNTMSDVISPLLDGATRSTTAVFMVSVAALASDIVLPIPSSVVSAAAIASLGPAVGWIALTAGSSVGCLFGYLVGARLGRPISSRLLTSADELHVRSVIVTRGNVGLILFRPLPVLAEASVIVAGACALPFGQFAGICLLSNGTLAGAYALLHVFLGGSTPPWLFTAGAGIAVPIAGLLIFRAATSTSNRRTLT